MNQQQRIRLLVECNAGLQAARTAALQLGESELAEDILDMVTDVLHAIAEIAVPQAEAVVS